jgi:hypothetical protein
VPAAPALPSLPPGFSAGPISSTTSTGGPAGGSPAQPGAAPPVTVQVAPVYSSSCAGAAVVAGPGDQHTVDHAVVACKP